MNSARAEKVQVVFILSWGRSGTTILDNLLGELEGFFSAGEVTYLWERGVLKGWPCGCGTRVTGCEVWSEVLGRLTVRLGPDMTNARTVLRTQEGALRLRHTPSLFLARNRPRGQELEDYLTLLQNTYLAAAEVTGSSVIVDSSKRPPDASLLSLLPMVTPYLVHVVRDPRGVAFSWSKRDVGIRPQSLLASSLNWMFWNLAGEWLRRYRYGPDRSLLVRYEDFAAHPLAALKRIVSMLGRASTPMPAFRDGTVSLGTNHTVSGNPSRFLTGDVAITIDDRWKKEMPKLHGWMVSALTSPLLPRYGYRLRSEADKEREGGGNIA